MIDLTCLIFIPENLNQQLTRNNEAVCIHFADFLLGIDGLYNTHTHTLTHQRKIKRSETKRRTVTSGAKESNFLFYDGFHHAMQCALIMATNNGLIISQIPSNRTRSPADA